MHQAIPTFLFYMDMAMKDPIENPLHVSTSYMSRGFMTRNPVLT